MFRRISHILTPFPSTAKPSSRELSALKPGQSFKGTVIQKHPNGQYLIQAQGRHILARTELDLLEGARHRFLVRSSSPKIILKVLDHVATGGKSPMQRWASLRSDRDNLARILTDLAGVKDYKGLSETSREGITALRRHMPAVIYQGSFKKGGPLWFSRQLSGNGLFWETKIARRITSGETGPWKTMLGSDLKGILLMLSKSVREDAQNHEAVKSVLTQVEQALHVIEQDQFFNLSTLRDDLGWFWFLPGRETEGFRKGEVLIKQQEKKGDYLLSLFLDYTQLGQMEVSLSWVESLLGVRIFLEEAEKAAFVEAHLSELIKGLEDADLKVGTVICDVREETASEGGANPDEKDTPTPVHVVI